MIADPITDPLTLSPEAVASHIAKLTPRQLEIIGYISSGRSDKWTSHILSIKQCTVRTHVQNALKRIGVDNRIQLVVIFAMWKIESVQSPKVLYTHIDNSVQI